MTPGQTPFPAHSPGVNSVMGDIGESRRRGPKVGHRKSRQGCHKCKHRRVKCDERRPICGSCNRLGLDCSWPAVSLQSRLSPPLTRASSGQSQTSATSEDGSASAGAGNLQFTAAAGFGPIGSTSPPTNLRFFTAFDGDPEIDLPESRERRLLEMRLMQNYIWNMAKPFAVHPGKEWGDLFERTIPAMALENDNLMSALMVVSASNLLMKDPDNPVLLDAQRTYLVKAVREQRIMIDALSVETADPICMTSLFLLTHSFASLRDRPLEPYTPPLRWLHMGRGAGVLIWMSVNTLNKAGRLDASPVLFVAGSYPRLGFDESYFDESMRRDFVGLLSRKLPGSRDVWDDETRDTYEKTLSYVGSIQNAINKQEPAYAVCRRIKAFPLIATPKFTSFVEECRPRALTILAHYFATTIQVQGPWWLGAAEGGCEGMAQREIRAIAKALPLEWQAQMVWPLDIASVR